MTIGRPKTRTLSAEPELLGLMKRLWGSGSHGYRVLGLHAQGIKYDTWRRYWQGLTVSERTRLPIRRSFCRYCREIMDEVAKWAAEENHPVVKRIPHSTRFEVN